MMTHEITYTPDFSDEPKKKTLYFNLRLSALQHMINYEGWDQKLRWIGEEFDMNNLDDRRKVQEFWDEVIRRSYGVRDGDNFEQSEALSDRFMKSAEYDALIGDILYTPDSTVASRFLQGLFPKKLVEQIKERGGPEVSPLEARAQQVNIEKDR